MKNISLIFLTVMLFAINLPAVAQRACMQGMRTKGPGIYLSMMDTMMLQMDKAAKAATFGNEFLAQMIPHHEGAVAMAAYEITHGKDFKIKQLAKSISAEQKSEVMLMRLWLRLPESKTDAVTIDYQKELNRTMDRMMADMPSAGKLTNTDKAFELVMIPHHQAAIDMARVLLKYSHNRTIRTYASQLIASEELEIEQMKGYLK